MWGPLNHLVIFLVSSSILVGDRAYGYRPVILMHGLLVSSEAMDSLEERILTAHPGTPVFNIDAYNDADSLKPMWQQVHGVYSVIGPILDSSPEGAILIGHSQAKYPSMKDTVEPPIRDPPREGLPLYKGHLFQPHALVYYLTSEIGTTSLQRTKSLAPLFGGYTVYTHRESGRRPRTMCDHSLSIITGGVIFRGILEAYPTSNITFISLASPMAGQYGTAQISEIIPLITKEFMYHYCYLAEGRHSVSICNWWKDPTQMTLYRTNNNFLYPLESPTDKEYKSNFERIGKLVLIGGPDDGIVEPWQSTQFGYYDKNMDIVECVDQEFYMKNSFGLRTLDDSGRLHIHTVEGVHHFGFHKDQSVFDCCIKQWLD